MFGPGKLLEARFRVASLVGEGGMGAVYRATDEQTGETVAIKVLKATVAASARDRFVREARVLAALDHPGIVRFKHMGSLQDGQAYLVMEWLEGEDLAQRNERQGVTFLEAVRVVRGAAEALACAHAQGLVHRDVKPANLFLVGGRPENVKVLDFGIARGGAVSATLTDPGMALGTPAYMAPEQARGGAKLDARTDIFALGCVLYECLAGAPPFYGDSPIACLAQILLSEPTRLALTVPGIPRALDALVSSMLQKRPADRPETVGYVARELGAIEPLLHVEGSAGTISARHVSLAEKRIASIVVVRDLAGAGEHETGDTLSFADIEHTLAPAREALERSGGVLTVLSDGTLLGVFSGAVSATDLARAAAHAALDLRARIPDRAFAIATDLASVSGTAATGAAVSRAFGLASTAGLIRVDATTRALIGDAFILRGTEGGTALEADRKGEAEGGGEAVGRSRELAALTSALGAVCEDHIARAVLLIGPAGQGKSCLVRAFLRAAQAGPEPRIARVRCDPLRVEVAFATAAELLSRLLEIPRSDDIEAQRTALDRGLREVGGDAVPHGFLAHLLGLDGGEPSAEVRDAARDPRLLADRTVEEWIALVGSVAKREPVVLLVENLHGCDGPSVRLLERALAELGESTLLLLATARPQIDDVHPRAFASRPLDRIQLAPLPRRAAETLVKGRLGSGADPAVIERIVEQGAGNPMFLLELAGAARDGLATSPPSVVALLQERLDRLEANARRVLRAASILGETFWSGAVETLVGAADAGSVAEWLAELVRRDLVDRAPSSRFPGEQELTFRSGLLRDAVYATLTDADRVVGHRLAGQWLEAHGETDPLRLARHFEQGNALDKAVVHFARAAELDFDRNDLPTAIDLVRRVESLVQAGASEPPPGFAVIAAKAHYWSVDRPAAIERAERGLAQVERGSHEWLELTAIRLRSLAIEQREGFHASLTTLLDELEADPALPRPSDAVIEAVMASLRSGERQLAERAVRVLGGAPGPLAEAHTLRARSWLAMYDGAFDTCIELDRGAAEAFDKAGHGIEALSARGALAYGYLQVGHIERAQVVYGELLEQARKRSIGALVHVALHNLGIAHLWAGSAARALELQREAMEYHTLGGPIVDAASCQAALALLALGRAEEADAVLEPVLGRASGGFLAFAKATAARVALARGAALRALALTEDAMVEVRLGSVEGGEGSVRNAYTLALAAVGRTDDASAAASDADAALCARAAKIGDPEVRRSFLEHVPENAETTRLAREHGGGSATSKSRLP